VFQVGTRDSPIAREATNLQQGVFSMSLLRLFSRRPSQRRSSHRARRPLVLDSVQQLEPRTVLSTSNFSLQVISGVVPQPQDNNPIVAFRGNAFFAGTAPGGSDVELWRNNGHAAIEVANINPTGSSNPANLTVMGNFLFFTATDGVHGTELWKTDG